MAKRGRKKLLIDKIEFQSVIDQIEAETQLDSHAQLWRAVSTTEWAKNQERPLTESMVANYARSLGVVPKKTPKGKPGLATAHNVNLGKSRKKQAPESAMNSFRSILRKEDVESGRFDTVIEGVKNGSKQALIKAVCLVCTDSQITEIKHCELKHCPLWHWRPYKDATSQKSKIE